jgi:hypothetical protein
MKSHASDVFLLKFSLRGITLVLSKHNAEISHLVPFVGVDLGRRFIERLVRVGSGRRALISPTTPVANRD